MTNLAALLPTELVNLIPIINSVIFIGALLSKSDKTVKIGTLTAATLQCVYFLHFEMYNSALVVTITMLRSLCAIYSKSLYLGLFFIGLTASVPLIVPDTDYLSVVAGIIGTIAFFFLSGWRMRLLLCCGSLIWYANNLNEGVYPAALFELGMASISLFMAGKLFIKEKRMVKVA